MKLIYRILKYIGVSIAIYACLIAFLSIASGTSVFGYKTFTPYLVLALEWDLKDYRDIKAEVEANAVRWAGRKPAGQ